MEVKIDGVPIPFMSKSITFPTATPDKYPQGWFKPKKCRQCSKIFTPVAPSQHHCSLQCATIGASDAYLKRVYGISIKDYITLYKRQNGKCAICKQEGFTLKDSVKTQINVDHNHLTGEIRGLLCPNCNRALGLLKDSKERIKNALEYLDTPTIKPYQPVKVGRTIGGLFTKETLFEIYDDIFINKLRTKEIEEKYSISRNTKRNIELGKTHYKELQEYRERATTIQ